MTDLCRACGLRYPEDKEPRKKDTRNFFMTFARTFLLRVFLRAGDFNCDLVPKFRHHLLIDIALEPDNHARQGVKGSHFHTENSGWSVPQLMSDPRP